MCRFDYSRSMEELLRVMETEWYIPAPAGEPRFPPKWCFHKKIGQLSDDAYDLLARISHLRRAVRELGSLVGAALSGWSMPDIPSDRCSISEELETTLRLMTVCEFGLDCLIHGPAPVRKAELRRLSEGCEVESADLVTFIELWHMVRQLTSEESRYNAA